MKWKKVLQIDSMEYMWQPADLIDKIIKQAND